MQLAQAVQAKLDLPQQPVPEVLPARGIYHPDAPGLLKDAAAFDAWRVANPQLAQRPAVALLVHRHHFVNGSTAWLDAWLRRFEAQGLVAYAVFGQQINAQALTDLLEVKAADGQARPHPAVLVLHQVVPQAAG